MHFSHAHTPLLLAVTLFHFNQAMATTSGLPGGNEEETISKCRFQNVTRHDHYECTSYRVTFKWSLFCNTLQHTARHCSRLNHIPILQHTATHCNILQHIGPESSCKKQGLYRPGALFWFVGLAHLLWHK